MPSRRQIENPPKVVQAELVRDFFMAQEYPVSCAEAADFLLEQYAQITGRPHFYVGSIIRRLYREGFLVRIRRGVYQISDNYTLTAYAKRRFIRLYYAAKHEGDERLIRLYRHILGVYDEFGLHPDIEWRE